MPSDRKDGLIWAVVIASTMPCLIGCTEASERPPAGSEMSPWSTMPTYAWNILRAADTMELVSLDPDVEAKSKDPDEYSGWKVLGRKEVAGVEQRRAVAAAVAAAVRKSDGSIGKCFQPRHGIKVGREGLGETQLVLCFACATMHVSDYGGDRFVSLEPERRGTLDELFEAQGLTVAP